MSKPITVIAILLACAALVIFSPISARLKEIILPEPTYRSDRLLKQHGDEIYRLAQQIERGDAVDQADLASLQQDLDARYGDEITLLFHAVASGNINAIEALIKAGADLRQVDRPSKGSARDFIYYLTLPGGDKMSQEEINHLLTVYLEQGGDPDARLQTPDGSPMARSMGMGGANIEGVRILLEAGADPWASTKDDANDSLMTVVNLKEDQFNFFDEMIDAGYFTEQPQDRLHAFFVSLGGYAQRGDEISKEIQRIAMRILKRNPDYEETSTEVATARIFKKHWKEPLPGTIPWDVINSDAVR